MQAYIRYPQANGKFAYLPYDGSQLTVEQADAWANSLSDAQKKALVVMVQPALNTGYDSWKVRVSPDSTSPNTQIIVLGSNQDYVEAGTGSGNNPDQSNNVDYESKGSLDGFVTTT